MSSQDTWFGRYRLLRRISVGGMAEVWHAKSYSGEVFEKEVALKRILPHIAEDESLLAMFIEEARVAARLDHPNVSHIYELGKTLTSYYLTMEYIYGEDLRSVLKQLRRYEAQTPSEHVAAIGCGVARGLAHAHALMSANGSPLFLVHRDVSPQNVMISYSGDVKLIDFGIAKAAGRALETQVGVLKGKLGYMAPEQLELLELDGRVDQFSLGILLWESLAGQRLFTAIGPIGVIELIRACEVPDLRILRPDCPESLILVVEKALQRDREDRFANCSELADALEGVLDREFQVGDPKHSLASWMDGLFPEAGAPALSEHEVKTLFSAEERGEEVTDPHVVDDATEVFIPDTTRIDIYRRQIEELLDRRKRAGEERGLGPLVGGKEDPNTRKSVRTVGKEESKDTVKSMKNTLQKGTEFLDNIWGDSRWIFDGLAFLALLGLSGWLWRQLLIVW